MTRTVLFIFLYIGAVAFYGAFNSLSFVHVITFVFWLGMFLYGRSKTRAIALLPAMTAVMIYDFLRVFAPSSLSRLRTTEVVGLERLLFGVDGRMPSEYFVEIYHPVLDFVSGLVYGNHVTPFAILGLYILFHFRDAVRADQFFAGFLLLNLSANFIQIICPVAPPWYFDVHGLETPTVLPDSNAAGLVRFDAIIGSPYFEGLYGKASYPFGAMPSLHVGFPTWVAFFCKRWWSRALAWSFVGLTAFYAVYTNHHYLLDVIAGIVVAGGVYLFIHTTFAKGVLAKYRQILLSLERNDSAEPM